MCECTANISLVATAFIACHFPYAEHQMFTKHSVCASIISHSIQHWEAYLFLQAPHHAFVPSGINPLVVGTSISSIASLRRRHARIMPTCVSTVPNHRIESHQAEPTIRKQCGRANSRLKYRSVITRAGVCIGIRNPTAFDAPGVNTLTAAGSMYCPKM